MIGRRNFPKRKRGQALIEMTLVGIPIIFVLILIFEISRGMWIYHTLAYSVKEGVRFAIVHGANCTPGPGSKNDCQKNVSDVAKVIQLAGVGLDLDATSVSFISNAGVITCKLGSTATGGCQSGANLTTVWPPAALNANQPGQPIEIDIQTPFVSAIARLNLAASSADRIQF